MRMWPLIVAALLAAGPADAGEVCLGPSSGNGRNVTVDCDFINPVAWGNAMVGFSEVWRPCSLEHCAFGYGIAIPYGWSISHSSTDPNWNTGALESPIDHLYLWLDCSVLDGMTAAEFAIETTGDNLFHVATTPMGGVLNAGTFDQPLFAVGGCPQENFLVAELLMVVTDPVSVESESWADVKAMYR